MKKSLYFLIFINVLLSIPVSANSESLTVDKKAVKVRLIDSNGNDTGIIMVKELSKGTLLRLDLTLPNGKHALHIHEKGKCDTPDFKTAGSHFNPDNKEHGINNPNGYHRGDLPNLIVKHGEVTQEVFIPGQALYGEDGLINRAIMVHGHEDNYRDDPTGSAGHRIACGVIGG